MEFRDRIKKMRTEKGMTHAQLAAMIERGESAVRMWEAGKSKPDMDTVLKLCEIFECSIDYMFGMSDFVTMEAAQQFFARTNVIELPAEAEKVPVDKIRDLYDKLQDFIRLYSRLDVRNRVLVDRFCDKAEQAVMSTLFTQNTDEIAPEDATAALYDMAEAMRELSDIVSILQFGLVDYVYSTQKMPKGLLALDAQRSGIKKEDAHADN